MSAPDIRPLDATLGAVVTGVALPRLTDEQWAAIETAFHEFAVLVFPGQHLSVDEQAAFGRRFGELSIESLLFSNCDEHGNVRPADHPLVSHLAGNEGWHTDSSFEPRASKASVLSAHRVPASGGETEWADMRAAYDALDDDTKQRISQMTAFHSLYYSQARRGVDPATTAASKAMLLGEQADTIVNQAPERPLVKVHPVTGRPALYIGRHAYGIPGLSLTESTELLDELLEHACQPPRVYTHRWQPGDVVVWDNRCVLHRARSYDHGEARYMVHTRVAGDPQTEHVDMVPAPAFAVA